MERLYRRIVAKETIRRMLARQAPEVFMRHVLWLTAPRKRGEASR